MGCRALGFPGDERIEMVKYATMLPAQIISKWRWNYDRRQEAHLRSDAKVKNTVFSSTKMSRHTLVIAATRMAHEWELGARAPISRQ